MESIAKSDIFFLISSVATITVAVFVCVLLFYIIKAAKILYKISEALQGGMKDSEEFVLELKERLEDNMIFQFFFPPVRRKQKARLKD